MSHLTLPPARPGLDPDVCDQLFAHLESSPVLAEIATERSRQDQLWGEQNHPDGTGLPGQAVAAGARLACQHAAKNGAVTWRHILWEEVAEAFSEDDPTRLRAELVQIAAVATAWIEAIDRRDS